MYFRQFTTPLNFLQIDRGFQSFGPLYYTETCADMRNSVKNKEYFYLQLDSARVSCLASGCGPRILGTGIASGWGCSRQPNAPPGHPRSATGFSAVGVFGDREPHARFCEQLSQ